MRAFFDLVKVDFSLLIFSAIQKYTRYINIPKQNKFALQKHGSDKKVEMIDILPLYGMGDSADMQLFETLWNEGTFIKTQQ